MQVHRIQLPLPFQVDFINVYLVESGGELLLVDAGLRTRRCWRALNEQVEAAGHRLADVRTLVLTHAHPDHAGQARRIKRLSGARVVAHVAERVDLERRNFTLAGKARVARALLDLGVPRRLVRPIWFFDAAAASVRGPAFVDAWLEDGATVQVGDEELRLVHVPGHAPGHVVLHAEARRLLFSADHLLPDITPAPLLQFPAHRSRPRSLVEYLASAEKVRPLAVDRVYPSHGEPFADHRALLDSYAAHHAKRQGQVAGVLAARPRTPFEVAEALFGQRAHSQMFLTLSEAVGHLEVMESEGRARSFHRGGRIHYEPIA